MQESPTEIDSIIDTMKLIIVKTFIYQLIQRIKLC